MRTGNGLAVPRPGPTSLFQQARPPRPKLMLISSDEFARADYRPKWLVKKVLVKGQPGVVGGPKKSLKTSTLVDLALALGTPVEYGPGLFLGHFEVPMPVRVAIYSGESGEHTLQETAQRIARARGLDLGKASVDWGFSLPKVAIPSDLEEVRRQIGDLGLEVMIIDPLYLCLSGGGADVDSTNLFSMGPVLLDLARACPDVGCTPLLAHHAKKGRAKEDRWEPLDLDDLAYAGISEFARQWMLINRRVAYEPGTGRHELWFGVGGSVGFGGLYGLDIEEGSIDAHFAGRVWDVKVRTIDEVRGEQERRKEDRKQRAKSSQDEKSKDEVVRLFQQKHPARLSRADLQRGTGWNYTRIDRTLTQLCNDGTLKNWGKGKASNGKMVDMYSLVHPPCGSTGEVDGEET